MVLVALFREFRTGAFCGSRDRKTHLLQTLSPNSQTLHGVPPATADDDVSGKREGSSLPEYRKYVWRGVTNPPTSPLLLVHRTQETRRFLMNYPRRPDHLTVLRVTLLLWLIPLGASPSPATTTRVPKGKKTKTDRAADRLSWFEYLFYVPILIWLALCVIGGAWGLSQAMTPWVGIPLGALVGVGVFYLIVQFAIAENGSTLMEVGCGLTIPLILVTILFPVFAQARDKARQTSCLTNLRTLGQAFQMYRADFDEVFPPADRWADALSPYLPQAPRKQETKPGPKSRDVLHCPADANRFSYAFNDAVTRLSAIPKLGIRRAEEARIPLLFESSANRRNAHDDGSSLIHPPRHNLGNNFLYADGHAVLQREDRRSQTGVRRNVFAGCP
jgi:prepilin-type processing-associated H-X9-DG protein